MLRPAATRAAVKKATLDVERDWGGPGVGGEWVVLYVRPFELDIADKGARCAALSSLARARARGDCVLFCGCVCSGTGRGGAWRVCMYGFWVISC